jgi:hypothetical protein
MDKTSTEYPERYADPECGECGGKGVVMVEEIDSDSHVSTPTGTRLCLCVELELAQRDADSQKDE